MNVRKKNKYTIDSHYLPRSYLNNFTKDKLLHWYDLCTEESDSKGVRGLCYVKYYYEVKGLHVNTLEHELAHIEKIGQACLDRIINHTACDADRTCALQYISSFRVRSPLFRYIQKDVCKTILNETDRYSIEDRIRRTLPDNIYECTSWFYGYPIADMDILSIKWPGDVLITSDNPVVKCHLNDILRKKIKTKTEVFLFPLDTCNLMVAFHRIDLPLIESEIVSKCENLDPALIRKAIANDAISKLFFVDKAHLIHSAGMTINRHEISYKAAASLMEDIEFAEKYWESIKYSVPGATDDNSLERPVPRS